MRRYWPQALFVLAVASASAPAHACRTRAPLDLADAKYADVVVIGRIANYRIVRDLEFRRQMLARPDLSAEDRRFYADPSTSLLPDYARFDVLVDDVLIGDAPDRLSVTWDNSTFGEPAEMPAGPFLIALRKPASAAPPLRGPSATIFPNREPGLLTVLQAPCAGPFIFESSSDEARAVRRSLRPWWR
jgi:hypothetical protein